MEYREDPKDNYIDFETKGWRLHRTFRNLKERKGLRAPEPCGVVERALEG